MSWKCTSHARLRGHSLEIVGVYGKVALASRGACQGPGDRETIIFIAEGFSFDGGFVDDLAVDFHLAEFGAFGWHAQGGEVWTEDRDQSAGDGCAELRTNRNSARVGHPVAWGKKSVRV